MSQKSIEDIFLFGFSPAFDAGKVVHLSRLSGKNQVWGNLGKRKVKKKLKEPQTICAVVQKQY